MFDRKKEDVENHRQTTKQEGANMKDAHVYTCTCRATRSWHTDNLKSEETVHYQLNNSFQTFKEYLAFLWYWQWHDTLFSLIFNINIFSLPFLSLDSKWSNTFSSDLYHLFISMV